MTRVVPWTFVTVVPGVVTAEVAPAPRVRSLVAPWTPVTLVLGMVTSDAAPAPRVGVVVTVPVLQSFVAPQTPVTCVPGVVTTPLSFKDVLSEDVDCGVGLHARFCRASTV